VIIKIDVTAQVFRQVVIAAAEEEGELVAVEEVEIVQTNVLRKVVQTLLVIILIRKVEVGVIVRDDVCVVAGAVFLICYAK
jgi:hypothetical protein